MKKLIVAAIVLALVACKVEKTGRTPTKWLRRHRRPRLPAKRRKDLKEMERS